MMADIEVSKIVLNIRARPVELTVEELRALYAAIGELLGKADGPVVIWNQPPVVIPRDNHPGWPYGPRWICTTSGGSARLEWGTGDNQ